MTGDRLDILPYDAEAERMILGSLLLDNSLAEQVEGVVRAEDFFLDAHKRILRAMGRLLAEGRVVDPVSLQGQLQRQGDLEAVGGMPALAALIDGCPRFSNVAEYARIVKERSRERRLVELGNWLMRSALDGENTVEGVIDLVESRLADLRGEAPANDLIPGSRAVDMALEYLREMWDSPDGAVGAKTGLVDVDRLLHGLRPSLLYILAARPGEGKTSLALNMAYNSLWRDNRAPVLFLSLEMSVREITTRAIATAARVDLHKLMSGKMAADEHARVRQAAEDIRPLEIQYVERGKQTTPGTVRRKVLQVKREKGKPKLVVVDYLGLMKLGGHGQEKKHDVVERLTNEMKDVAMEFDVPVLLLHQMNRDVERSNNREPELSDLRDAGEQAADVVMFIHNPTNIDDDLGRDLIIRKHRNGRTGKVSLLWWRAESRFECAYNGG